MYREFKTYDIIPYAIESTRKAYVDTADTGDDYLCAICYVEQPEGNYVTDVLYTKKPMEYTEPATAEMLSRQQTEEPLSKVTTEDGALLEMWKNNAD